MVLPLMVKRLLQLGREYLSVTEIGHGAWQLRI